MEPTRDRGEHLTVRADRVVTPTQLLSPGWVSITGGHVTGVGTGRTSPIAPTVDLGDRIVAPGFVDVHVHGGGGAQVNGGSDVEVADSVRRLAAFHARHGTTSLLATTVCDTTEHLVSALQGIGRCTREGPAGGARVLGAHLEGPWLSEARAGAQDAALLRLPYPKEVETLLDADPGVLRMVTLAPELPGGLDAVRRLADAGVVVAIGHTDADYDQTRAAFDAGASHVTHLFNAMRGIHHRRPGPVVAALADRRVTVEVIADGVHVDLAMLGLVARTAPGRIVTVTDAIAATGMADGRYQLGRTSVDVAGGRATLHRQPATLAGSLLTMDRAVATWVAAGVSLSEAIRSATRTPSLAIGDHTRGRLEPGSAADLVVLEPDLSCAATLVDGIAVHDPHGLFSGVDQPARSTKTPHPR